mgnify:CR=1 FL=1
MNLVGLENQIYVIDCVANTCVTLENSKYFKRVDLEKVYAVLVDRGELVEENLDEIFENNDRYFLDMNGPFVSICDGLRTYGQEGKVFKVTKNGKTLGSIVCGGKTEEHYDDDYVWSYRWKEVK